ncbi:unnamed protein product, partial [Strongylus vulgaris]
MHKAIAYMEERMQVYQNTLMAHDLVVSDENSSDWRKGFVDPRYNVMMSKRVQTSLTAEALSRHEDEFASTKRKLTELHSEVASNRSDLTERFAEIERILLTKTQLVDTLSKQLEDTRRDQRQEIDSHQEERESYKKYALKRRAILKSGSLPSANNWKMLWKAHYRRRCRSIKNSLNIGRAEISHHLKEKEDMKMKSKLERADLERRLTSSIDHVAMLNSQINKSRRDVECEARPRHVSKYVACRPNSRSKSTTIAKGDLFDESEERLKLCQGELATTRRQVHVLQQKLISTMQEKADKRVQVRRRIACVVDRDPEPQQKADHEKLEALETRNAELREQEMNRYESEKTWLKSRIRNLETDNEELQRTIDAQAEGTSTSAKTVSM